MKIVLYDDNYKILEEIPFVTNARAKSLTEVTWEGGGATFNAHYIIMEDQQNFEDYSQEEIFSYEKHLNRLSLATNFIENQTLYIADMTEDEEKSRLNGALENITAATNREELTVAVNNYHANL